LKMWQISAQFLPQLLTNKKNQFLAPQTWLWTATLLTHLTFSLFLQIKLQL
jgi:hypothetical protein